MKGKYYTSERHTQILIALMKFHGVRKIVVSPGATNVCFVGSVQQDSFFELYSSVDERSAAYIACGLARESGEAVALSCTGATASRNYVPGLTEAFYSNLPILAVTSSQQIGRVGQLVEQVTDRSNPMNDLVKMSVLLRTVRTETDAWEAGVTINDALLELRRTGGGPVHINLETVYSKDYSVKELPIVKGIRRFMPQDEIPDVDGRRIVVRVENHAPWTRELTKAVEAFCEKYNAVVCCDGTGNYSGKYAVNPTLLTMQEGDLTLDLMIQIGSVSKNTPGGGYLPTEVWRVHPDGRVKDTYRKLTTVFQMREYDFFEKCLKKKIDINKNLDYYKELQMRCSKLEIETPELPFSDFWLAQNTRQRLQKNSVVHIGTDDALKAWSFFAPSCEKNVEFYSEIDDSAICGLVTELIGSAIAAPQKIFIGIVDSITFIDSMNTMLQQRISENIKLIVRNEKSSSVIHVYANQLGFEYMSVSDKTGYLKGVDSFLSRESERPILMEVSINTMDKKEAIDFLRRKKNRPYKEKLLKRDLQQLKK